MSTKTKSHTAMLIGKEKMFS